MSHYILRDDDGLEVVPATLVDQANLGILDHPLRREILALLADEAMFPAELARELEVHEQKVYYHMKQLANLGLVEKEGEEQVRGATATRYSAPAVNFAHVMDDNWKKLDVVRDDESPQRSLLSPFVEEGVLDADIVVGSPDPHGPYKSYARDGHYATDLALGLDCSLPEDFSVKLDVDVKAEQTQDRNMIVVGGPGTNIITQSLNEFLPARFDIEESDEGFACTGITDGERKENGEHMGIVSKAPNPYDTDKSILVLAGYRCIGSKTAVIGLTRFADEILQEYKGEDRFGVIVDGFDMDGDGKIDSVELV